jgi:hypothetical protein
MASATALAGGGVSGAMKTTTQTKTTTARIDVGRHEGRVNHKGAQHVPVRRTAHGQQRIVV